MDGCPTEIISNGVSARNPFGPRKITLIRVKLVKKNYIASVKKRQMPAGRQASVFNILPLYIIGR